MLNRPTSNALLVARRNREKQTTSYNGPVKVVNASLEQKTTPPSSNAVDEKASPANSVSHYIHEKVLDCNQISKAIAAGNLHAVKALFLAFQKRISNNESWKNFLCDKNARGVLFFVSAVHGRNDIEMLKFIWNEIEKIFPGDAQGFKEFLGNLDNPHYKNLKKALKKALRIAIHKGKTEIVKDLLEISQKIMGSETAEFLDFLIDKCNFGNTVVSNLCKFGHLEIFKLIMDRIQHISAALQKPGIVEELLTFSNHGSTPLNTAAAEGHAAMIELLFDIYNKLLLNLAPIEADKKRKKFIMSTEYKKFTPLQSAIRWGHISAVEALERKISDPALLKDNLIILDSTGFSALGNACYLGNPHMLRLILSLYEKLFGSNSKEFDDELVRPNDSGFTPLSSVFATTNKETRNKAIVFFLEYLEKTYKGHPGRLKAMLSCGSSASILNDVIKKDEIDNVNAVVRMLEKNLLAGDEKSIPDSNAREALVRLMTHQNNKGFTPLINACALGNIVLVTILLDLWQFAFKETNPGGLIDVITQVNHDGYTPLISAYYAGSLGVVKLLVEAAIKLYGGKGNSPELKHFIYPENPKSDYAWKEVKKRRFIHIDAYLLSICGPSKNPGSKSGKNSSTLQMMQGIGSAMPVVPTTQVQLPVSAQVSAQLPYMSHQQQFDPYPQYDAQYPQQQIVFGSYDVPQVVFVMLPYTYYAQYSADVLGQPAYYDEQANHSASGTAGTNFGFRN